MNNNAPKFIDTITTNIQSMLIKQIGAAVFDKPQTISLDKLNGGERPLTGKLRIGGGARTTGPIDVIYNVDTGEYLVTDGHTRVDQAIAFGKKDIQANITPVCMDLLGTPHIVHPVSEIVPPIKSIRRIAMKHSEKCVRIWKRGRTSSWSSRPFLIWM